MEFFVGVDPWDAARVNMPTVISVVRLRRRKSKFQVGEWIMDSGAFSTILNHGGYPHEPDEYAGEIERWKGNGNLLAAVSQDYMCEPEMLKITGMSVEEHQALTIERYDSLSEIVQGCYLMPVLQGWQAEEYVRHVRDYGARLTPGQWVGVGSVCRRNAGSAAVEDILLAIRSERPDLLLHGFGLKITVLRSGLVRHLLHSADSRAWSYAARREGRDRNDWREAVIFAQKIQNMVYQRHLVEVGL